MNYCFKKIAYCFCLLIMATSSYVLFGMQGSSVGFDEVKVNAAIIPNLMKQARLKKYKELYNALDPLPEDLVNLILDYDVLSLPPVSNAGLFGGRMSCVKRMTAHSAPICCIVPLQQGFASAAYYDDQVKIWDQKGDLNKVLYTKMSCVDCMQELPNGDLVVTGYTPKNMKIIQTWKLDIPKKIKEVNSLYGYITCMTMVHPSDGGQKFICGDNDGRIEIYHPLKKEPRVIQERGSQIHALAALAHQRLIVARRDGFIQLLDWSNEDKDPVLKDSVYFNEVASPSVSRDSWSGNNIHWFVPMSDSVIAFGDHTLSGKWGRITIKDDKIAAINIEPPHGIGVRTIKRFSKDVWAIILTDGTAWPFTIDKQNAIQHFNGRDGKPLVWDFGKQTTSFSVLQQPKNWMITGNTQGELLLWCPEVMGTYRSDNNSSGMKDESLSLCGDNTIQETWNNIHEERFKLMYDVLDQMPRELVRLIAEYDVDVSPSKSLECNEAPQCVKKVKAHNAPILCIVPLQEGCATATTHDVKLWNEQGALKKVLPTQMHTIRCMLWLANKWLVVAGSTLDWMHKKIETIQGWNPVTYKREEEIKEVDGEIATMIPVNAQKMAYGLSSGKIAVRDIQARNPEIFRKNNNRAICALVLLDDLRMLSADYSGVIQLWDLGQRKLMHQVVYKDVVSPAMMGECGSDISCLTQMESPTEKNDESKVSFISGWKRSWGIICISSKKNRINSVAVKKIMSDSDSPITMQTMIQNSGLWLVLSNGEAQRLNQEKGRLPAFSLGNHLTTAAVLKNPKNWIVSGNVQGELQYWR